MKPWSLSTMVTTDSTYTVSHMELSSNTSLRLACTTPPDLRFWTPTGCWCTQGITAFSRCGMSSQGYTLAQFMVCSWFSSNEAPGFSRGVISRWTAFSNSCSRGIVESAKVYLCVRTYADFQARSCERYNGCSVLVTIALDNSPSEPKHVTVWESLESSLPFSLS